MKIKINWGGGLVIGMALFIGFILVLVTTMLTDKRFDHDLVTESYYQKELHYQNEIDAENRGRALAENISDQKTESGWLIEFPKHVDIDKIKGKISFYRPSNKALDFSIALPVESRAISIPAEKLAAGKWRLFIDWEYEGETYLYKSEMIF